MIGGSWKGSLQAGNGAGSSKGGECWANRLYGMLELNVQI